MIEVVLYRRPGCELCDEVRAGLEAMSAAGRPIAVREVNVDADESLRARFTDRVPVIELAGEEVCDLGLDRGALEARLDTVSA